MLYDASMNSPAAADPADKPRRKYNSTRRSLQAAQTREMCWPPRSACSARLGGRARRSPGSPPTPASPSRRSTAASARRRPCCGRPWTLPSSAMPNRFRSSTGRMRGAWRRGRSPNASTRPPRSPPTSTNDRRACGSALIEAAAADPEIDGWRQELERGRRIEVDRSVRAVLGPDVDVDEMTVDLAWVIFGPEVYLKVTTDLAKSRCRVRGVHPRGFLTTHRPTVSCAKLRR